jgi:hypothetical protein
MTPNLIVAPVVAISGRTVYEVQHVDGAGHGKNQTMTEPFVSRNECREYRNYMLLVKGTSLDPFAHYWKPEKAEVA